MHSVTVQQQNPADLISKWEILAFSAVERIYHII